MARFLRLPPADESFEEDPLAGIANLFDVSVVFIVGLMISLFSLYRMGGRQHWSTLKTLIERLTLHVLRCNIEDGVVTRRDIKDRQDVGVIQRRNGVRLALKPLD